MPDPSSSNLPSLTVLGGDKAGAQFVFEEAVDNVLIGADPSCRFCLDLPGVSPVHARIWIDDTGITIYDTNSPRGLYVNDDQVQGQVRLRNGDIIWLGAPGDEQSVMIQCRVPGHEAKSEPVQAAEEEEQAPTAIIPPQAPPAAAPLVAPEPPGPPRLTPAPIAPAKPSHEFEEDLGEGAETVAVPAAVAPPAPPTTPVPTVPVTATPRPETLTPRPPSAAPPAGAAPSRPVETRPAAPPHAPRPARPSAPRPAPAARPGAHPTARPRRSGGGLGRALAIVLGVLVLLGAGGGAAWYFLLRPQAGRAVVTATPTPIPARPSPAAAPLRTPEPAPTPESTAQAAPSPIEVVIPVTPTPSLRATPTPRTTPTPRATPTRPSPSAAPPAADAHAQQLAARVAPLMGRAEQAVSSRSYDAAVSLYDEVLSLDPQNSTAASARAAAASAAFCWKRSFVPGRTVVQSGQGGRADLKGFESSDVKVAKAPDYSGLIDFQASPARVVPGDAYAIRASLTNDGKKAYRIATLTATLVANGNRTPLPTTVPAGEVQPRQTVPLAQTNGSWPDGARSWTLEVVVTTAHGETFTSQLGWR